jgi:hypothetical protein
MFRGKPMRQMVTTFLTILSALQQASATWFARNDSSGKLVPVGIAANPDESYTAAFVP